MKYLIVYIILCLSLAACRRDDDNSTVIIQKDPSEKKLQGTIIGQVYDEYSNPIPDAKVYLDGTISQTNIHGYFQFKEIVSFQDHGIISINKEGYFLQIIQAPIYKDDISYISTIMRRKPNVLKFSAKTDFQYNFFGQMKIAIKANSFHSHLQQPYLSEVDFSATMYRAKLNDKHLSSLPSLAKQKNGALQLLEFLAVVQVEAKDENMQIVKLNQPVELELAMSRLDLKSEFMKVYFFDENKSLWLEDTTVIVENGLYKANIKNWERFAIAIPHDYKAVEGTVSWNQNIAGWINLQLESQMVLKKELKTSQKGHFRILVPKKNESKLFVLDACNAQREYISINQNDDRIDLKLSNVNYFTKIEGTVTNCNGMELENGYILVNFLQDNPSLIPIFKNLNFSSSIFPCDEKEIQIIAYDALSSEFSIPILIDPKSSSPQILQTCKTQISTLARIKLDEQIQKIYRQCQVKQNVTGGNLLQSYQLEWESSLGRESYVLTERMNPTFGKYWLISSIQNNVNQYEFPDIISAPEIFEFDENGVKMVEILCRNIRIKDLTTQVIYQHGDIFLKAQKI